MSFSIVKPSVTVSSTNNCVWTNTIDGKTILNLDASNFSNENILVYGSDMPEDTEDSTKNQIMMFVAGSEHADSGAFRAGIVSEGAWTNRGRASVAFGDSNQATGLQSGALGGAGNSVHGTSSTVVNGDGSAIISNHSTVCGGQIHAIHGHHSTIAGGYQNFISNTSNRSFIGAGMLNTITGVRSGIVCGEQNAANAMHTCVVNGFNNIVNGGGSTVLNGSNCIINGANSVSGGMHTTSGGNSTFMWGDGGSEGETETTCDQPFRFVIGSTNGIQLGGCQSGETVYPTSTISPSAGSVVMPATCDGYLLLYLNDGVGFRQIKVPFFIS